MSIRELPKINAFEAIPGVEFTPEDDALARWNPAIAAASEGDANVISIYDVIGDDIFGEGVTSKRVAAALRRIGSQDVTVNINSPGGDFFEGLAIYNLLRDHPHAVTVKVMGLAASAASVIAMAGDRILVPDAGFLMVHRAWGLAIGNQNELRQVADMLAPFDDAMATIYSKRAGVEKSAAEQWIDAETWFNGAQAVDAGLADAVLDEGEMTETDSANARAMASVRKIDILMARGGLPRSERRQMLNDIKGRTHDAAADPGTPSAAPDATHDAGEIVAGIRSLIDTLK